MGDPVKADSPAPRGTEAVRSDGEIEGESQDDSSDLSAISEGHERYVLAPDSAKPLPRSLFEHINVASVMDEWDRIADEEDAPRNHDPHRVVARPFAKGVVQTDFMSKMGLQVDNSGVVTPLPGEDPAPAVVAEGA